MELPFVSIIVLNYNGAHFLPTCLDALQAQTYPPECFEVIVTDNGSTDGSIELLKEHYAWVRVLENGRNLGFSTANNAATRIAGGDYIVLLNNDTAPEPMWIEKMVEVAQSDPRIGIVTGHLRLYYDQLELTLETETFSPPDDPRSLGVMVHEVSTGVFRGVVQYLEGFYWREGESSGPTWRWTQARARLGLPVPVGTGDFMVNFQLAAVRPGNQSVPLRVFLQDRLIADWVVPSGGPHAFTLELPATVRAIAKPVEQNTGSILFRNCASRDRGTYVRNDEVFYETDVGQYSQVEEVFAACGASLLMRREMIDEVGLLDDDFFIYYEDTDLSWRAQLYGWKVVFSPEAYVRHIHCGTNTEWSPFFIYLTGRNRLAMVFKNGTWGQVLRVWGEYYLSVLRMAWRALRMWAKRRPDWRQYSPHLNVHARIASRLVLWLPSLLVKRIRIQRGARVPKKRLESWFVKP